LNLAGYQQPTPADQFQMMADWCRAHEVRYDVYGEGKVVQDFEQKVQALLDKPSALFTITGTLTQVTALRLACERKQRKLVGLHASSHILVHENSNHELLQHFHAIRIGNPHRTWTVDDLRAIPDRLAAVQYELPMREIGGQLPSWQELEDIKAYCKEHDIHLHMDGARLWEAQAGFDRPFADIARGFDSVYVSLYKGVGGFSGALLLGETDFIAEARAWMHRQGGSVFRRTPMVVAAALQFDQRLAMMPRLFARTKEIYQVLAEFPQFLRNPQQPHCNMLHLYLPVSAARANAIRNQVAAEHKIWLFNNAVACALPEHSMFEWSIGDYALQYSDEELRKALSLLANTLK